MRYLHAAQNKLPPRYQSVNIVTNTDMNHAPTIAGGRTREQVCSTDPEILSFMVTRLKHRFAYFPEGFVAANLRPMEPSDICDLCGRKVSVVTRHHLIPRTRHSNKRNKRQFQRSEVKHRIAWLCWPCHDHVHALFTEKTLERDFNTLESLAEHPEVRKFLRWIRKKPPDFRPTSYDSARKG